MRKMRLGSAIKGGPGRPTPNMTAKIHVSPHMLTVLSDGNGIAEIQDFIIGPDEKSLLFTSNDPGGGYVTIRCEKRHVTQLLKIVERLIMTV